ncbi:MAG: hypothetical protein JJ909_08840 [Roseivirga sp.]|uniref:MbnP family protein n=1 Tax=Roseivirga sp. TaxID=1964215 RepID=UPI001B2EB8CA|nr:MbnP family protein [Roseivirga sp.]MBO6659859.1 hypothetical protein [Roseivirga sp.]MBO6761062.1 hypothetical protein [Roseivirga sp.]MBO6907404.1 hypothetical protein [Roseivirga sp.]
MKISKILALLALIVTIMSCENDEPQPEEFGTFQLYFDNKVGASELTLSEPGSTNYNYETTNGEKFNLSRFGYYVSKIKLEGPNGELYEDEVSVSASESKGYYQILESVASSHNVMLENVPAGSYSKVTFTIGVAEDGVQEGALGGVLDPAKGAWFWNWNAGYIGMAIEGTAENSAQQYVDWGNGAETKEKTFAVHVGGWKDVTDNENFVNNVRTRTLDFGTTVSVSEELSPNAHVVTDVLKLLDGVNIDFSTTYSVHAPKAGKPFADQLANAFVVHHVHQSSNGHDH